VARLTTYLDLKSREILKSGFNFKSNLTSAIGNLENCGFLASYVSRHKDMADDISERIHYLTLSYMPLYEPALVFAKTLPKDTAPAYQ
jgi:hypothetical protein